MTNKLMTPTYASTGGMSRAPMITSAMSTHHLPDWMDGLRIGHASLADKRSCSPGRPGRAGRLSRDRESGTGAGAIAGSPGCGLSKSGGWLLKLLPKEQTFIAAIDLRFLVDVDGTAACYRRANSAALITAS
jgi:hypothetical protein